jgi:hypothetical protein
LDAAFSPAASGPWPISPDPIEESDRRSPKGAVAGERYHASGAALLNG